MNNNEVHEIVKAELFYVLTTFALNVGKRLDESNCLEAKVALLALKVALQDTILEKFDETR